MANNPLSDDLQRALSSDDIHAICQNLSDKGVSDGQITAFFDARGLKCPMPLLKAKVALRDVADTKSLYLIASDKNSQTDLVAFCQKQGLNVVVWADDDYHFIITKPAV